MVTEVKIGHKCQSANIVKNGSNGSGNPKYKCKNCGFGGVFQSVRRDEAFKETVVRRGQERSSSRGLAHGFGISHQTALNWIKKAQCLPDIVTTLLPAKKRDVLELDELWSYVYCKANKRWVWTAICRRTRQVVSFFHRRPKCRDLSQFLGTDPARLPAMPQFQRFLASLPEGALTRASTDRMVGKETGETAHVERWNNTLRQRIGRFVRKTLAFSKTDEMHELYLHLFIYNYNQSLKC